MSGFEIDGERIISSNEALFLQKLPERMIIIGGGAVGVEFAYLFSTYGVKITLLEALSNLLPEEDSEIADILEKSFKKKGIDVFTGVSIKERKGGNTLKVMIESKEGAKEIEAETILVAVGREPNTAGLDLEKLCVRLHNGFIHIDEGLETSVSGIFAIGDVAGPPLLAHKAMAEGLLAAEIIAGVTEQRSIDRSSIPRCAYTNPQVAAVGLTEKEALEAGYEVKIGRFPFRANGKALALGESEGLVKIVSHSGTDEILGAQLIGPEVTEILGEITLAKVLESTSQELSSIIHPHPTLSEAIMEAAGMISGHASHIVR
jgi:dihydrolipoamide dehydrogenase